MGCKPLGVCNDHLDCFFMSPRRPEPVMENGCQGEVMGMGNCWKDKREQGGKYQHKKTDRKLDWCSVLGRLVAWWRVTRWEGG